MTIVSYDPTLDEVKLTLNDGSEKVLSLNDFDFAFDPFTNQNRLNRLYIEWPGFQSMIPITDPTAQKLFVYKIMERHAGRTWEQAKTLTKVLAMKESGARAWYLEELEQGA